MRAVVGLGLLQSLAVQDQLLPLLGMELQPGTADTKCSGHSNQDTRNKDTSINMTVVAVPNTMIVYLWTSQTMQWLATSGYSCLPMITGGY